MAEHELLTNEEFSAVTQAWIERLRDGMRRAGCNDVFASEFPESVAKRFSSDYHVLEAWETTLSQRSGG